MKRNNEFMADTLACLGIIAVFITYRWISENAVLDPDQWYHIALSRILVEQSWLPRVLPQLEDLGWGNFFENNYYAFQLLLAPIYALGGIGAVQLLPQILGCAILFTVYRSIRIFHKPREGFALCLLAILLCARFVFRLTMLRPHLLAILFYFLLLHGLLKKDWKLVALGAFGFALSYHAYYLPLLALVLFLFPAKRGGFFPLAKENLTLFYRGCGAMLIGAFAYPYFPANFLFSIDVFQKTMGQGIPSHLLGMEVRPIDSKIFFQNFSYAVGIVLLAMLWRVSPWNKNTSSLGAEEEMRNEDSFFLLPLALITWAQAMIIPRAIEYAVPLSALALAYIIPTKHKNALYILLFACLPLSLPGLQVIRESYAHSPHTDRRKQSISALLEKIPERGAKVFNSAWNDGPYIIFARPDLRFIDVLDAHVLYRHAPALFHARNSLNEGISGDPYDELKTLFHADYLLCSQEPICAQLRGDPDFELAGHDPGSGYHLYHLKKERQNAFATQIQWQQIPAEEGGATQGTHPFPIKTLLGTYHSFYPLLREKNAPACAYARVSGEELREFWGKTWIGIGGGKEIFISFNGHPFFHGRGEEKNNARILALVPLEKALSAKDFFDLKICAEPINNYFGASLSFWDPAQIRNLSMAPTFAVPQTGLEGICHFPKCAWEIPKP